MDPSKTIYGERNPASPNELGVFSFLVGKWQGTGKTTLADGTGRTWSEGQIEMTFRRLE